MDRLRGDLENYRRPGIVADFVSADSKTAAEWSAQYRVSGLIAESATDTRQAVCENGHVRPNNGLAVGELDDLDAHFLRAGAGESNQEGCEENRPQMHVTASLENRYMEWTRFGAGPV